MPLFEYQCLACDHVFEVLVRADTASPACPQCAATTLARLPSLFGVSSEALRQQTLARARTDRRRVMRDRAIAEAEDADHHRH